MKKNCISAQFFVHFDWAIEKWSVSKQVHWVFAALPAHLVKIMPHLKKKKPQSLNASTNKIMLAKLCRLTSLGVCVCSFFLSFLLFYFRVFLGECSYSVDPYAYVMFL